MLTAAGCWRHCGPAAAPAPDPSPSGPRPPRLRPSRCGSSSASAPRPSWICGSATRPGRGGETLDFANPRSNATGGALDADRRCGDPPPASPDRDDRFPAGASRPLPDRRGPSRALRIGAGPAARCPSASSCGTASAGKNAAARSPWERSSRGCSNSIARRSLRDPTPTDAKAASAAPVLRRSKEQTPRVFRPGAFDFRLPDFRLPISRTESDQSDGSDCA